MSIFAHTDLPGYAKMIFGSAFCWAIGLTSILFAALLIYNLVRTLDLFSGSRKPIDELQEKPPPDQS